MCELAGISRSGYYNWIRSASARHNKELRDEADFALILEAYKYRGYAKGARSIHMRLLHLGIRMNLKKIRRLMKKYNLFCPIRKANPYRRMAKAIRTNAVADNRVKREFRLHGPRKILLTDITYIPYAGRFCYLSVIKDAFTEQALSHVLSESLEVDFVLETVNQLIHNHGTSLDADTMIHSDQGCHYTSIKFRELIANHHLRQSMSRRGNCWDNAPQESFFGHMKDELADKKANWTSFEDVCADINDWMDYYNTDRGQWNLQKLAPNEFYKYITTGINPLSTDG
jgi:transposase InsO family protein